MFNRVGCNLIVNVQIIPLAQAFTHSERACLPAQMDLLCSPQKRIFFMVLRNFGRKKDYSKMMGVFCASSYPSPMNMKNHAASASISLHPPFSPPPCSGPPLPRLSFSSKNTSQSRDEESTGSEESPEPRVSPPPSPPTKSDY